MTGESVMSNRSLGEQLQAFYNCILISPEEADQRQLAFDRVKALVAEVLPTASVHLVGSSASGLASKNSSVDMIVEVDEEDGDAAAAAVTDRERADRVLAVLRRREGEFLKVEAMHSRQVSVLSCVYRQAELRCSVRLTNGHHRRVAAFLGGVAALCEPFRLLTVVTREWALSRQLIRRKGALTGYAIALLVLFHMEQGGLVPPEVVRALARGSRKSEVSEALRRWQPEPLSIEQLGEQFCGLVRYFATLGFFASGAPCVLSGRLLDRGREDPFAGARVSLPCPVSGENVGRTYSRASDPEEPFFRTALNLSKDHDLFTACFTRNLDGMRKAKLVQQLPAFKRLEEQNLVPPMQRLVERVQRTLENRGRPGYEKFAGRLAGNGRPQEQQQQQQPMQQQYKNRYQNHFQYQQRPRSVSATRRIASSPVRPPSQPPPLMMRQVNCEFPPRPPRSVLVLPRSNSGGRSQQPPPHQRRYLEPSTERNSAEQKRKFQGQRKKAALPDASMAGKKKQWRSKSNASAVAAAANTLGKENSVEPAALVTAAEEAVQLTEDVTKIELSPAEDNSTTLQKQSQPPPGAKPTTWAAAAAKQSQSKSASAAPSSDERRPLSSASNRSQQQPPQQSQSLPAGGGLAVSTVSYASVVSGGKRA